MWITSSLVRTWKCSSDLLVCQYNLFRGRQEKSKFHHGNAHKKIAFYIQTAAVQWKVKSMGSEFKSHLSFLPPMWSLTWLHLSEPQHHCMEEWVQWDSTCKELRSVLDIQRSFSSDYSEENSLDFSLTLSSKHAVTRFFHHSLGTHLCQVPSYACDYRFGKGLEDKRGGQRATGRSVKV